MPRKAISVSGVRASFFSSRYKDLRECGRQVRWHEIGEGLEERRRDRWDYIAPFLHNHNNVVEENEVYNVTAAGCDGSSINITGNAEGNIIRRNYIHHNVKFRPDAVIRCDGNGRGTIIAENIIYNCAPKAIVWMDEPHHLENNIIVDASTMRKEPWWLWYRFGAATGRIQRNIIYHSGDTAPFFGTNARVTDKNFKADFNLYYSAGNPDASAAFLAEMQKDGFDEHSVSTDPLFQDMKNGNFLLKPYSPMLKRGFKQIDTSKIGLTADFPDRYRPENIDTTDHLKHFDWVTFP
jgi:hypothetical protein